MDLFAPASWLAVHIGQLNYPERLEPLIAYRGVDARDWLAKVRGAMEREAQVMPGHGQFIHSLIG